MTERISKLKQFLLDNTHFVYRKDPLEGTVINDDTIGLPLRIRKALAFKKALEEMPIYIQDGELILGGRTVFNLPAYYTEEELKETEHSGNNVYDPIFNNVYNESVDERGDKVADTNPINYQKLLKKGLGWYRSFIEEHLNKTKAQAGNEEFYEASLIVIEAAQAYIGRFSQLINEEIKRAENNNNTERAEELKEIQSSIVHISQGPPRTFYEGLQLMHFMHVMLWVEAVCLVSLERVDQNLIHLYESDVREGRITEEKAVELIECFLIKLNFDVDRPNNRFAWLKGDTGQTITLGGTKSGNCQKNGENSITFLFIRAIKELGLIDPNVHVRIHEGTSDKLWNEVIDFIGAGRGLPIIDFDENIKKGLEKVGIYSNQDICDYAGTGCWEIIIPGKTSYRQCANIDLLRPLEWLLYHGVNPRDRDENRYPIIDGRYTGIDLGDLDQFRTFNDFFEAYKKELKYYLLIAVSNVIKTRLAYNPFLSVFVDNCLERGSDIKEGGAKYRETDFQACSLANIADSLYSIKKMVFEEGTTTLNELSELLRNNYDGKETLHQYIINKIDKFGNAVEEVDALAKEVAEFFAEELTAYTNGWGHPFRARVAGASSYVDNMELFTASADGRSEGDYTSHNSSPQIGYDKVGPTGIINSVTRIDTSKFAGGFILDLKFSKDVFSTQENKDKFKNLLKGYKNLGGLQLQINVVDTELLRDAKKHPEKHKDLVVRVWGFSAYFVDLPEEFQDHVIKRSELGVG